MGIPLQAVIFDYGNVLCAPQPRADVEAMAAILNAPVAAFEQAYWETREAFDAAAFSPEEYWAGIAAKLGREVSNHARERLIAVDNRSWSHPAPIMPDWASRLRSSGIRTAVLSNMPVTLRAYLESGVPWLPAFDHLTFSCDVRIAKPAAGIFHHCLDGLNAAPEATLFLDDREENVRAAQSLGIHSLCFRTPEQAQCEMNGRYRLPVPLVPHADCGERASQSASSS
jgi:putative hydrolase of the HAD superfamily